MTAQPENWEAVKALFDAALEEDSAQPFLILEGAVPRRESTCRGRATPC